MIETINVAEKLVTYWYNNNNCANRFLYEKMFWRKLCLKLATFLLRKKTLFRSNFATPTIDFVRCKLE